MPGFDPVRDAVLNSPISQTSMIHPSPSPSGMSSPASPSPSGRRATDISVLLNSAPPDSSLSTPPTRAFTLSRILRGNLDSLTDTKFEMQQPIQPRRCVTEPSNRESFQPSLLKCDSLASCSHSPQSSSASVPSLHNFTDPHATKLDHFMQSPVFVSRRNILSRSIVPYNPRVQISPETSVTVPLPFKELEICRSAFYKGSGSLRIMEGVKRRRTEDPEMVLLQPPSKRQTGDVGIVVNHYNSRPDVGMNQRTHSSIIGLKNFNNWVKSILISRFAQPALAACIVRSGGIAKCRLRSGKVLDLGCGKGGDLRKWQKARVREYVGADIASVSIEHARKRWEDIRGLKFKATFATLDCYTRPLTDAFGPDLLGVDPSYSYETEIPLKGDPFDAVSMQFCMHYAFETERKVRCMLENISKYLRKGGVFIGTVPNADTLMKKLDAIPLDAKDFSFGNSVFSVQFRSRHERPMFGDKYWFFLKDAVENIPEYVVVWDNFVRLAHEYNLYLIYRKEFHQVYDEHHNHSEFRPLMIQMKVTDLDGQSTMDKDQWDAANLYIAFAFEKR